MILLGETTIRVSPSRICNSDRFLLEFLLELEILLASIFSKLYNIIYSGLIGINIIFRSYHELEISHLR